MRRHERGLNIIELTITLALLGVLGSVAIPALNGYSERARINRAIGDISRISVQLYRWRTNTASASFPSDPDDAGITLGTDPWGNAYSYLRIEGSNVGQRRKDRNLNPVNTDFDLYSNGPDGRSVKQFNGGPARDDIVRASNGAFVGKAEDY